VDVGEQRRMVGAGDVDDGVEGDDRLEGLRLEV
jgi:hypothetical protein